MANPWNMLSDLQLQQPPMNMQALNGPQNPASPVAMPMAKPPSVRKTVKTFEAQAPSAFDDQTEAIRKSPEVQAQRDAIDKMENNLNALQTMPQGGDDRAWIKPLLGLVDSQTGSNLSQTALTPQQTPQERNAMILKYQDDISKRKQDMNKEIINAATARQTKGGNTINVQSGDQLGGLGSVRRMNLISQAGLHFDNDKMLLGLEKTNQALDRADSLLNGKVPITPANYNLAQQDFINAMAPGGAATEGKVNREMQTFATEFESKLKNYFSLPEDLRNSAQGKAYITQLKNVMNQTREDFARAARTRTYDLKRSFGHVPDQEIQDTVKDKSTDWENKASGWSKKASSVDEKTVRMKDPSGNIREIPESQIEAAKAAGGTQL